jgi:hypothetical protein
MFHSVQHDNDTHGNSLRIIVMLTEGKHRIENTALALKAQR